MNVHIHLSLDVVHFVIQSVSSVPLKTQTPSPTQHFSSQMEILARVIDENWYERSTVEPCGLSTWLRAKVSASCSLRMSWGKETLPQSADILWYVQFGSGANSRRCLSGTTSTQKTPNAIQWELRLPNEARVGGFFHLSTDTCTIKPMIPAFPCQIRDMNLENHTGVF